MSADKGDKDTWADRMAVGGIVVGLRNRGFSWQDIARVFDDEDVAKHRRRAAHYQTVVEEIAITLTKEDRQHGSSTGRD